MRSLPLLALLLTCAGPLHADLVDDAATAMRRAANYFHQRHAIEGGYHFNYSAEGNFGSSEHARGPSQISVQREGTPGAGLAYLEAWQAGGEPAYLDLAREAGDALMRGQLCSGGWSKLIEFDPAKRAAYQYRLDDNCTDGPLTTVTSLDDNVSQGALRLLMRLDLALKFEDQALHAAALAGLDGLLAAQYPNGAWPQQFVAADALPKPRVARASYPKNWARERPGTDYGALYTFNDNTLADLIDVYLEAYRIYQQERYLDAARNGGEFILRAQIPQPQPAWAQQYDFDMQPAWARGFEPPAVSGGESQGVLQILLVLYRETDDRRFLSAIPPAVAYLRGSALPVSSDDPPRKQQLCASAALCLARFYELGSNRPLYVRAGEPVPAQGTGKRELKSWQLTYDPQNALRHYSFWVPGDALEQIEQQHKQLAEAPVGQNRRKRLLQGISPWQQLADSGEPVLPATVRSIIAGLDERGAWVEQVPVQSTETPSRRDADSAPAISADDGLIADPENTTIQLDPDRAAGGPAMISTQTFIDNLRRLSQYISEQGSKP